MPRINKASNGISRRASLGSLERQLSLPHGEKMELNSRSSFRWQPGKRAKAPFSRASFATSRSTRAEENILEWVQHPHLPYLPVSQPADFLYATGHCRMEVFCSAGRRSDVCEKL